VAFCDPPFRVQKLSHSTAQLLLLLSDSRVQDQDTELQGKDSTVKELQDQYKDLENKVSRRLEMKTQVLRIPSLITQGDHKVGEKNSDFSRLFQSHKLTFP